MTGPLERTLQMVLDLGSEGQERLWALLVRHGVNAFNVSPRIALAQAREGGGSDFLREVASQGSETALAYARDVDGGPHDVTRRGVCERHWQALDYAILIDKGPRDDTREAACRDPQSAMEYADRVDKGPHPMTRKAACGNPNTAYHYADVVDEGPRDDTREAVCSSQDNLWELVMSYAQWVDKGYHPRTWEVIKGTPCEDRYRNEVGLPEGVE